MVLIFKIKAIPFVVTMGSICVVGKQVQVFFGDPSKYQQQGHCHRENNMYYPPNHVLQR